VWSRNLKNEEAMARVGPQRHQKKNQIKRKHPNCKSNYLIFLHHSHGPTPAKKLSISGFLIFFEDIS